MAGLLSLLEQFSRDMEEMSLPWALIGALAVGVHTEPRTTRDVDVALASSSAQDQEALVKRLLDRGYGGGSVLMHALPVRKMGYRLEWLRDQTSPIALDLLFASSGIESEVIKGSEHVAILPGLVVPVASRGHLIAMKILSQNSSDRLQDHVDLQKLLRSATPTDIHLATVSLQLISDRGFSGGKDLKGDFKQALTQYTSS